MNILRKMSEIIFVRTTTTDIDVSKYLNLTILGRTICPIYLQPSPPKINFYKEFEYNFLTGQIKPIKYN